MEKKNLRTPVALREKIVHEYLSGNFTARELGEKYGKRPGTIGIWALRYRRKNKYLSLPPRNQNETSMARKKTIDPREENELLKKRVKELEAKLYNTELQNLALNTMIDIAEEQGIRIRKKSGARQ